MQLPIGQHNTVKFNADVMSSSQEPRVRVVIGSTPELVFPASLIDGKWSVDLAIPESVEAGSYDLRVEVLLNNRLFTPLNKRVELTRQAAASQPTPAQSSQAPEQAPQEPNIAAPAAPILVEAAADSSAELQVSELLKTIAAATEMITIKPSAAPAASTITLGLLQTAASAKPRKMYERLSSGLPKPGSVKAKPIKVTIAQIDGTVKTTKPKVVAKNPEKMPMTVKENKIPIRLIKGDIIYK